MFEYVLGYLIDGALYLLFMLIVKIYRKPRKKVNMKNIEKPIKEMYPIHFDPATSKTFVPERTDTIEKYLTRYVID